MTPYTERRHAGHYNEKGDKPESTTTDKLAGIGAPQAEKPQTKKKAAAKK